MLAYEADEEAVDSRNPLPDPFATINDMFPSEASGKSPGTTSREASEAIGGASKHEDSPQEVVRQSAQMSTAM